MTYRDVILNALEKEKFETIIEFGCGEGNNLEAIKEKFGVRVYGTDIDEERVAQAKGRGLEVWIDNVIDTKLPKGGYDIAFTYATLIYLTDEEAERAIKNMLRVAKKVIVIELHSEKSNNWDESLSRVGNRNSRNYIELFKKLGKEVEITRIPKEVWAGTSYHNYGYVIKTI